MTVAQDTREIKPSTSDVHDRNAHDHRSLRDLHDVSGLTLSDHDLMEILGLKRSSYGIRKKAGLYKRFEVRPQLGHRTQYSGALVQKWRDGFGKDDPIRHRPEKAGEPQEPLRLVNSARSR